MDNKIGVLLARWQRRLGLNHWTIYVQYASEEEDEEIIGNYAYVEIDVKNLLAIIRLNKEKVSNFNEKQLEETILHELLHVLLRERYAIFVVVFGKKAEDILFVSDEQVVNLLVRAFKEVTK